MSTLAGIQQVYRDFLIRLGWANRASPSEQIAGFCDEVARLSRELHAQKINQRAVAARLTDIVLRSVDIAGEFGIDLQAAMQKRLQRNFATIDEFKAENPTDSVFRWLKGN